MNWIYLQLQLYAKSVEDKKIENKENRELDIHESFGFYHMKFFMFEWHMSDF